MAHIADAVARFLGVVPQTRRFHSSAEKSGKNAKKRRFARPIFPEKHVAMAGFKRERNLAQRGKCSIELGDGFKLGGDRHELMD